MMMTTLIFMLHGARNKSGSRAAVAVVSTAQATATC